VKKKLALLLLCNLVLLTTCKKDIAGPDGCFQEDVLPIFISNCTMSGCHNSKDKRSGYDLSNYEGIMTGIKPMQPFNSEIYNTIKGKNPSMPEKPYSKLSSKDVSMIKLWINMGASNTSNCKTCDTANFDYSGRIKGIVQNWCVGCHNSGNSGGGFDLSDYNGIIKSIPNNKLLGSIKHMPGVLAMPQTGGQLSKCEITSIEKWINNGYPNN
jgi:hypothetical protein